MKKNISSSMMTKKFNNMLLGGTLSIMVVSVMLMSDSLIAGFFIGSDAVAGITLVTPLYSVAAFFSMVISLAVPILYSSKMGMFQKKEADQIFQTGFSIAIVTGVALFVVISFLGEVYLQLNNPSEEILIAAKGYLKYIKFTILLLPLSALLSECIYADGDEVISTISNLVQAIGNVSGSIILCNTMGIEGISLASFIFYIISTLILCIHFLKKNNTLKIGFFFSYDILKTIVRYSVIDAGTYLFIGLLTAILNIFIGTRFGSEALILISVVSLSREFQLTFDGIGEAISPILSIYLGEGCIAGVRKIYNRARVIAIVEGIIVSITAFLVAPLVPQVLHITDAAMGIYAVNALRIISLGSVFVSILYLMSSYDILIDKISLGFITSAFRDVLLSAPLAVILGCLFGIYGVFSGIAAGPALATIMINIYLKRKYTEDPSLLLDKKDYSTSYLYEYWFSEEQIVTMRDRIAEDLQKHNYSKRVINEVMILFEDVSMLIHDKNKGISIEGECAVILLSDRIRMIFRDTGAPFDVTDSDMTVSSLRSYVISNVASQVSLKKQHLSALNFNRNAFEVKT